MDAGRYLRQSADAGTREGTEPLREALREPPGALLLSTGTESSTGTWETPGHGDYETGTCPSVLHECLKRETSANFTNFGTRME